LLDDVDAAIEANEALLRCVEAFAEANGVKLF